MPKPILQIPLEDWDLQIAHNYFHMGQRFAVSPEGWIAGVDPSAQQIVLISPQGKVQARSGGKGQGPGEFSGLDTVAWLNEEGLGP